MKRIATALAGFMVLALPAHSQDGSQSASGRVFYAGPFSFSDELGGFSILSVSGNGDREKPFVIVQEFASASPATLVIRALGPSQPFTAWKMTNRNVIYMTIETVNASGIPWVEFEFELQRDYSLPSVFGDGLSFDQVRYERDGVSSDRFLQFNDDFEPYDRLRFSDGHVDPRSAAQFRFVITDFNPHNIFYLRQDPRIPLG